MDKKDEEEIEKWKKENLNYVETYGINIFKDRKESKVVEKLFNTIYKLTKIILIIFAFSIVIFLAFLGVSSFKSTYNKLHADPIKTISQMYNKKVTVISSKIDENKNGEYILSTKENPEVVFRAKVEWNTIEEDYSDSTHKYYFEKWQNSNKYKMVTQENNKEILQYSQYIEINKYEEIDATVNLLYQFVDFAEEGFYPDWDIYIKLNEYRIYPFDRKDIMSLQDIIKNVQKEYKEIENGNRKKYNETQQNPIFQIF